MVNPSVKSIGTMWSLAASLWLTLMLTDSCPSLLHSHPRATPFPFPRWLSPSGANVQLRLGSRRINICSYPYLTPLPRSFFSSPSFISFSSYLYSSQHPPPPPHSLLLLHLLPQLSYSEWRTVFRDGRRDKQARWPRLSSLSWNLCRLRRHSSFISLLKVCGHCLKYVYMQYISGKSFLHW